MRPVRTPQLDDNHVYSKQQSPKCSSRRPRDIPVQHRPASRRYEYALPRLASSIGLPLRSLNFTTKFETIMTPYKIKTAHLFAFHALPAAKPSDALHIHLSVLDNRLHLLPHVTVSPSTPWPSSRMAGGDLCPWCKPQRHTHPFRSFPPLLYILTPPTSSHAIS